MQSPLSDKVQIELILLNSSHISIITSAALAILTSEQVHLSRVSVAMDRHIWSSHLATTMQLLKWDDKRIQQSQNCQHIYINDKHTMKLLIPSVERCDKNIQFVPYITGSRSWWPMTGNVSVAPGSHKESKNEQVNESLYSPVKVCHVLALSSAINGPLLRSQC